MIESSPSSWVEINKEALLSNIRTYKALAGPHLQLAAVIKSNAYGHGLLLISQICDQESAISALCIASLSDAVILRTHGIQKTLIALSYLDDAVSHAVAYDIDIPVYSYEHLHAINAQGIALAKPVAVHLKIDTGLSRLGIPAAEALPFIKHALTLSGVRVKGVFTHFSESNNENQAFTQHQAALFNTVLESLEQENIYIKWRHAANSAAIIANYTPSCNLARLGAGLYGLWPSEFIKHLALESHPQVELIPILTWKARIIALKKLPAQSFVGYDRTFQTTRTTTLAILPVGYNEGYDRRLSNKGYVRIGTHYAPVIGRVCMNLIMIDVTDMPTPSVNDEVVLMEATPPLTPWCIANLIESHNPREITTRISPNLPRIISNATFYSSTHISPNVKNARTIL